jgi:hypothetical protein
VQENVQGVLVMLANAREPGEVGRRREDDSTYFVSCKREMLRFNE